MPNLLKIFVVLCFSVLIGISTSYAKSLEEMVANKVYVPKKGTDFKGSFEAKKQKLQLNVEQSRYVGDNRDGSVDIVNPPEEDEDENRGNLSKCSYYNEHPGELNDPEWTVDSLCTYECNWLSDPGTYEQERGNCQECMSYEEFMAYCEAGGWL